MKKLSSLLLGKHYISTICGYAVAGLLAYQDYLQHPTTNTNLIIAVGIAVLGRISADADKVPPTHEN